MNPSPFILRASGAPQWANCSGSLAANAGAIDRDTQAAREGTATHWVGATTLEAFQSGSGQPLTCDGYVGQMAPNGVMIDSKMAQGAQVYVDDILAVAQEHGALQGLLIEHKVHMPQIHQQNGGTLDCGLALLDKGLIYIWDGKFGHRDNRALGNEQLIDYTAGLMAELNLTGIDDQHITVILRIVQPFCYHAEGPVNEWRVMLSDLRPYFNILRAKAEEALVNPNMSSGKWCRDCDALGRCAVARKANYNLLDYVNEPYDIDNMSGPDLATERAIIADALTVAKARLDAIEDNLHHRISSGATDTGLALETSAGRLAWSIPIPQAVALAAQFGVDAAKADVLTPTQTIDAAKGQVKVALKQTLQAVTGRPAGKLKLIDAKDSTVAAAFRSK